MGFPLCTDDDDNYEDCYAGNPLTYHLTSPRLTPTNWQTLKKTEEEEKKRTPYPNSSKS